MLRFKNGPGKEVLGACLHSGLGILCQELRVEPWARHSLHMGDKQYGNDRNDGQSISRPGGDVHGRVADAHVLLPLWGFIFLFILLKTNHLKI